MALAERFKKISKFFRLFKSELKKVNWPDKDEILSYTTIVLVTVLVLIIFIGIIDFIFSASITPLILR